MNNKKITHMLVLFSTLFMALIVYLTVTDLYYRDEYTSSSLNSRNAARETNITRGTIYDRSGTVLAETKDGTAKRVYPYSNLYSHVIGYSSSTYGKSLIESVYNNELLGNNGILSVSNLKKKLYGEKMHGADLTLTLDHELQKRANELMKSYTGAAVAMNPQTGEILAMVSKPDFDPDEDALSKNWNSLSNSESSPFLTRATMGLYPPGSTFKLVTTAAMLENGFENSTVEDSNGYVKIGSEKISNAGGERNGHTDLHLGFIKSSNVFFADTATKMSDDMLLAAAEDFMFNKKTGVKFPHNRSRFTTSSMSEGERAITAIGQGKTLATPLHLAMIASAISNDGKMMRPYIVSKVSSSGYGIVNTKPYMLKKCLESTDALTIKDLMRDAVKSGTGRSAQIYGMEVCGKTGTAENEKTDEDSTKTHAVFVGFAPYDNPQIAVSVVLEYAGSSGGTIAAPIAREIMKKYFEIQK